MKKKSMKYLFVLMIGCAVALQAQEKPQPEQRKTDVPVPASEMKQSIEQPDSAKVPELPKIDLPEYVITGIASIDLPEVEKEASEEDTDRLEIVFKDPVSESRDRETIELIVDDKQGLVVPNLAAFYGKALVSSGTFFTSRLGLWLGKINPEYNYLGQAEYHVARGYIPFTNRSGGNIDLKGDMLLHSSSSVFDQMTLGGNVGYGSETYRFYGSPTPYVMRTIDRVSLGIALASPTGTLFDYDIALSFKSVGIKDSSNKTTEQDGALQMNFSAPAWSETLTGSLQVANATRSGAASGSLPYIDFGIGSTKIWWKNFFLQPAVHFYYAEGLFGQKLRAVYPHVSIGYRLSGQTVVSAAYKGEVRRTSFASQLEVFPYLSATTLLRHANVQADVMGAIETDWSEIWRTRFSARYQSLRDYPLYDEPFRKGVGSLVFAGTTNITSYAADIFAKFSANSYFAISVTVRSTKNSITNLKIPYVSDFEASVFWLYTFPFGLTVTPRVNFVDRRKVDVFSGANTPEYWLLGAKAEYSLLKTLDVFLDLHNLFDRRYDEWQGYRATPFLMRAGLSFRW